MDLAPRLIRPATLADLEALPPTWRGEILDDTLYAFPRPRAPHASVEGLITTDLTNPFQRGRGGPGGWWILPEPSIQLPRAPEISPDLAGFRRERLPALPSKGPITLVPDWVCEILSPSTASYDQIVKRRFYNKIGVPHIWYVDPRDRTLLVAQHVEGRWMELGLHGADEKVRAAPFDAIEIDLAAWWEGIVPEKLPDP
ncbi:Uma2 family endonuclease [Sorangium sp. So ce1128]